MKLIKQIHNTWAPGLGSVMSLHKKQGGRRGRMNFTERAHVFSTPNVTFWNQPEDFLATDSRKKLNEDVTKVCTLKKNKDSLKRKEILTLQYYGEADNVFYLDTTLQIQCFFTAFFSVHTTKTCFEGSISWENTVQLQFLNKIKMPILFTLL